MYVTQCRDSFINERNIIQHMCLIISLSLWTRFYMKWQMFCFTATFMQFMVLLITAYIIVLTLLDQFYPGNF